MLALRRTLRLNNLRLSRTYAANSKLVEVTQDNDTGITTLSMARAPANSLNVDLLNALRDALTEAKKNSKGIILTSSLPTIFSAGLDLFEMYNRDKQSLTEFWSTLQQTWLTLYGMELPVAAAVNGASPAGGCLLAMSCDYRVFADGKHTMGLNETRLGITAPKWFKDVYISTVGHRRAEFGLLLGSLYTPKQALDIGLVDELASDKEEALSKCKAYLTSYKNIPLQAVSMTKLNVRKPVMSWLQKNQEEDLNTFMSVVMLPKVQKGLQLYIESLKQK